MVPPFYLNGYNRISKEAFQPKRERFYKILSELEQEIGPIAVYDYLIKESFSEILRT